MLRNPKASRFAPPLGSGTIDREQINGAKALGSATQIAHVFMNLLVNAAHALKSASREQAGIIKVSCTSSDGFVRIAVRDEPTTDRFLDALAAVLSGA